MPSDGSACPGCGVVLPVAPRHDVVQAVGASEECAALRAEVLGFQFQHPVMLRFHQMTVDAYGAQHAGPPTPPIRVAYALAGLWLEVEHGFSGEDVRAVHRRMGEPDDRWPEFLPPDPPVGWRTVADVASAGMLVRSESGHARAVTEWAESVWDRWLRERPGTDDAVEELLRRVLADEPAGGLRATVGPAAAVHRVRSLLSA